MTKRIYHRKCLPYSTVDTETMRQTYVSEWESSTSPMERRQSQLGNPAGKSESLYLVLSPDKLNSHPLLPSLVTLFALTL